jgi:iron complex outermembrane receptor protein
LVLGAGSAAAQSQAPAERITVTGRAPAPALTGFGDVVANLAPMQAGSVNAATLAESGARNLSDLTRLDAAASDAYNSEGYWSALTLRGFVLDARGNYRRDGLPIHAETWLPLANKERIEILAGTSGQQAGTSSPGGLVNLVVKRPTARPLLVLTAEVRDRGTTAAALDWSGRAGADGRFGWRLNAGASQLKPGTHGTEGESRFAALALEWRLAGGSLLEAEFEHSHRSQPSVPAMSLFGERVPDADAIHPRTNLNTQAWSQPVVFDANTASLRWRQALASGWTWVAHASVQRLRSDDRVAFPFGCDDGANGYLADRYCADGRYDLYDYRSDGERRNTWAGEARAEGSTAWFGAVQHWAFGLQRSRLHEALPDQAFNYSGQGQVGQPSSLPAAPDPAPGSALRRAEANSAAFVRARLSLPSKPEWQLWLGLRTSRIERRSTRDGVDASQRFGTPWAALQWAPAPAWRVYASMGQGVEAEAVPNRAQTYRNAGRLLPALRSRQRELGLRFADNGLEAGLTAFDIRRPQAQDRCETGAPDPACVREAGPTARHRGWQAQAGWRNGGWELRASAMALRARIESPGIADAVPPNVPERSLKFGLTRELSGPLHGLALGAGLVHEGPRRILPGESISIPGWTRLDLHARFAHRVGAASLLWRLGLDNATDTRGWRESPYQFGHAWLFPLAPRSLRVSVEARL